MTTSVTDRVTTKATAATTTVIEITAAGTTGMDTDTDMATSTSMAVMDTETPVLAGEDRLVPGRIQPTALAMWTDPRVRPGQVSLSKIGASTQTGFAFRPATSRRREAAASGMATDLPGTSRRRPTAAVPGAWFSEGIRLVRRLSTRITDKTRGSFERRCRHLAAH